MLLFWLDVKFQVYEKICTKLLLINFNNVYHCIWLVWRWVLIEIVLSSTTSHKRKSFICTWLLIIYLLCIYFLIQETSETIFHINLLLSRDTDVAKKLSRGISAYWTERPTAALGLMSGFAFTLQRGMTGTTGAVAVVCSGVTWWELRGQEMVPYLYHAWVRGARLRLLL